MFKNYKMYASYNNFYKSKRRYDNNVSLNRKYKVIKLQKVPNTNFGIEQ